MKQFTGVVIKKSGNQTIRVEVEQLKVHPLYGKRYLVHRNFLVHDQTNAKKVGDRVTFAESKPISKKKRFVVVDVKT